MGTYADQEFWRLHQWLQTQDMTNPATLNQIFYQFRPLRLDFSRRHLPNENVQKLFIQHLAADTTLQELNLQGNGFGTLLEPLVNAILNNPGNSIHTLILRDNNISGKAGLQIARLVGKSTKIQRLDVAYNRLGEDNAGVLNLLVALRNNTQSVLNQFDLSFNGIANLLANEVMMVIQTHKNMFINFNGNPGVHHPEMKEVLDVLQARPHPGGPPPAAAAAQRAGQSAPGGAPTVTSASEIHRIRIPHADLPPEMRPMSHTPPRVVETDGVMENYFDGNQWVVKQSPADGKSQSQPAAPQPAAAPAVGPPCSHCKNLMKEFQYKCFTCDNYSLCLNCYNRHSRNPLHSTDHCFVGMEIEVPPPPPPPPPPKKAEPPAPSAAPAAGASGSPTKTATTSLPPPPTLSLSQPPTSITQAGAAAPTTTAITSATPPAAHTPSQPAKPEAGTSVEIETKPPAPAVASTLAVPVSTGSSSSSTPGLAELGIELPKRPAPIPKVPSTTSEDRMKSLLSSDIYSKVKNIMEGLNVEGDASASKPEENLSLRDKIKKMRRSSSEHAAASSEDDAAKATSARPAAATAATPPITTQPTTRPPLSVTRQQQSADTAPVRLSGPPGGRGAIRRESHDSDEEEEESDHEEEKAQKKSRAAAEAAASAKASRKSKLAERSRLLAEKEERLDGRKSQRRKESSEVQREGVQFVHGGGVDMGRTQAAQAYQMEVPKPRRRRYSDADEDDEDGHEDSDEEEGTRRRRRQKPIAQRVDPNCPPDKDERLLVVQSETAKLKIPHTYIVEDPEDIGTRVKKNKDKETHQFVSMTPRRLDLHRKARSMNERLGPGAYGPAISDLPAFGKKPTSTNRPAGPNTRGRPVWS